MIHRNIIRFIIFSFVLILPVLTLQAQGNDTEQTEPQVQPSTTVPGPSAAPATDIAPEPEKNSSPVPAPTQTWRSGIHIGFSPNMGMLGAEFQKGRYGMTVGFPASIGIKIYPNEEGTKLFCMAHAVYDAGDDDETIDDIDYDSYRTIDTGIGLGYKWRWKNHWDVVLSLSADFYKEEHSGPSGSRTETGFMPFPGLTIGYTF